MQTALGNPLILSFDDALESVFTHALPVLTEHAFHAITFVPVDFIGKVNTWDAGRFGLKFRHMDKQQLRTWVETGNEIGCHGASHIHFGLLNHFQRYREIVEAKKRLEDTAGSPVRWLSPPFGWYDRHVLELARDAGYEGVLVIRKRPFISCPPELKLLEHTPVYLFDSLALLHAKLDPTTPLYRLERFRTNLIHQGSWGSVVVQAVSR